MAGEKEKRHILIIEDEESIRSMLQTRLYQFGFSVSIAATGLHAVQKFKSGQLYDLVICDLKMPGGLSGLDLYREYTNLKGSAPFVILTGYPERKKIMEAVQLGVRDVILKPIKHSDLLDRINLFLSESEKASQAA